METLSGAYNGVTTPNNQTLPYGGGNYNPSGESTIFPKTPAVPVAPAIPNVPEVPEEDAYAKYRDPKTGDVMSPEEYAIYLGNKIPKGTGVIPNYAGDAVTNPNESTEGMIGRATDINNARNDIATGEKDPYGVGNKSGIAYSPTELKAIENAYAGVFDPALNDVFSRLRDKSSEDAKKDAKESRVFATNEAIRQWKATTGTGKSYNGGGGGSSDSDAHDFTDTQLAKGATNSPYNLADFQAIEDDDIKNFYINQPMIEDDTGKKVTLYSQIQADIARINSGETTNQEVAESIKQTNIPETVRFELINMLPDGPVDENTGGVVNNALEWLQGGVEYIRENR